MLNRTIGIVVSLVAVSYLGCSSGSSGDGTAPVNDAADNDTGTSTGSGPESGTPGDETGAPGTGETSAPPDDSATADDAVPATEGGVGGKTFTCNQVIGVSVTGDWFNGGFLKGVDTTRWQAKTKLHQFVELWADPKNAAWSIPIVNPCAKNATNPDRVIFTGVNWTYTTAAQWVTSLTAVVENIKSKYPGVKQIELLTMLRAPGNKSCGSIETVVQPFIDEAILTVSAKYPGLVIPANKFYAPSCTVFTGGGPHYTAAGVPIVAKVYSDYYSKN
ncbi:MAG: hypothetical protein NVSMB1_24060 [Polyangiales bacterium]